MIKEQNIRKLIIIIPVIGVLLSSIILTNLFISEMKNQYNIERKQLIANAEKDIKVIVKNRVENTLFLLEKDYNITIRKEKKEIKNTINIAYKLIENIYNKNKHLEKKEILNKIKERLGSLRFYTNMTGYYFIFTNDGTNVLHPHLPQLEGKNFKDIEVPGAKKVIKTFLDILQTEGESFVKWKWYKPNESILKEKIGFIKKFKPLDIFIASAKYEEDINKNAKNDLQDLLNIISYDKNSYIFAYDKIGNTISHIKSTLVGKNRWNLNIDGRFMVQEIVRKAKREEGAFLKYIATYNPATKRPAEKISYVKNFNKFDWAIGSGEYTSKIVEEIKKKEKILKEKSDSVIYQVLVISIIFTIVSIIIMLLISNKITEIFTKYKNHLKKVNETLELKVKYRTIELEDSKEKLKQMALRDPLTNLYNRRYFETIIDELMALSSRNNEPLCLLLLDIDHFKKVNDTYGHDIGDLVLKELSSNLIELLRKSDVITRIGGEEFAIVFPKTDLSHSFETAEKIRKSIEKLKIKIDDKTTINFTISIGVTKFEKKIDTNTHTMIKRADKALYKAKDSGRNKVVVYEKKEN